ncbi:hypothetical protein HOP60_19685 [Halomonas daqingensis]|uniref:DUF6883 domain-containing protein n=1 Tax=Billgrantia desiderata TaxID=52021 RepID=A0ABS9BB42_9GAMM|nr:DUF6883 domain-containing protein [Halomonas desiderata]MCE8044370.1 hypothetical protein [Halomonas desiderata]MCE8048944.1 hypothetical protein [Halomonas desiderata]
MAADSLGTIPVAFLFVAPLSSEEVEEWLDEAFLRALKVADPNGTVETRVYRGGVLLAQLCYKVLAIKAEPAKHQKPDNPMTSQVSRIEHADQGLYATLVGDFVESSLERWHTVDRESFWENVGRRSLDATFVPTLSPDIAARMDQELRSHRLYIGAVSPDLGNPLHRYLFIEALFKDAFLRNGRVYVEGGFPGADDADFIGAEKFSPSGLGVVPYDQFNIAAPSLVLPAALSARGLVSKMRMERRMALNIHQKIMHDLSFSRALYDLGREFEWDLSQLPDAPEEVNVQASKIADYLLDPDHKDNRGKAKFFEDHLGITNSNWTYLHSQLVDALGHITYEDVRIDNYGVRFTANLPIIGKNKKTATIETGWIVRPGERASFVTAYPGKKNTELEERASPPPLVSDSLKGDVCWQELYGLAKAAGLEAMQACVPEPLVVEKQIYMEGDCGGATIILEDGRKSFSRWLKKNGYGYRHYKTGYVISAERIGQSAESAMAYAEAFARVLRRNGISCRVEIYYS